MCRLSHHELSPMSTEQQGASALKRKQHTTWAHLTRRKARYAKSQVKDTDFRVEYDSKPLRPNSTPNPDAFIGSKPKVHPES
jgi:hypothetical protein